MVRIHEWWKRLQSAQQHKNKLVSSLPIIKEVAWISGYYYHKADPCGSAIRLQAHIENFGRGRYRPQIYDETRYDLREKLNKIVKDLGMEEYDTLKELELAIRNEIERPQGTKSWIILKDQV